MIANETVLAGVYVIEPARHSDARGFFSESWNKKSMEAAGLFVDFVQDNHSFSAETGTIRGLHFQGPPFAQAKLVRCVQGRILDAVVDVRKGSPSYGKWLSIELSAENGKQLFVPEGFLHGFATREPMTEIVYKVNAYYEGDSDGAVLWDSCGIDWGIDRAPVLSDKDANAIAFANFDSPFQWASS